MTKPNGKPCRRCGERPKLSGRQLCSSCFGKCVLCGNEAAKTPADHYRRWCSSCRTGGETRETCSRCGKARDGSHPSFCRVCYRAYSRDWAKANPDKVRAKSWRQDLKRTYGLTPDEWFAMLKAQGGGCAVCKALVARGRGRFHVDHNHATGRVRGLLCTNCNVAIGFANDDPARLRALAAYLESASPP